MIDIVNAAANGGIDTNTNSNKQEKSNNFVGNLAVGIVGGIVAGAVTKAGATALKFGGRAGMVGINAGKEFVQNKKAMKNAVEEVTEQAAKDLNVAQQVVKTSVDGTPITYNFHSHTDVFGPAAQQVQHDLDVAQQVVKTSADDAVPTKTHSNIGEQNNKYNHTNELPVTSDENDYFDDWETDFSYSVAYDIKKNQHINHREEIRKRKLESLEGYNSIIDGSFIPKDTYGYASHPELYQLHYDHPNNYENDPKLMYFHIKGIKQAIKDSLAEKEKI